VAVNPLERSPRTSPIALFFLAALGVLLVYAGSATHLIDLPGVYMDAVNPDYLVAKVLNRAHAEPLVAWVLPGNYLAGRFPVLVSLYHGLQQFWLALPLYALFGMSVTGIRQTHMVFALGVVIAALVVLRRAQVPLWIAALAGTALAMDPTFIFAFRTQSYITLSPAAWLLLSLAALAGPSDRGAPLPVRHYFASGVCFGFAVLGYFVYAFYLPAMVLWMLARAAEEPGGAPSRPWMNHALRWLSGMLVGCAYYVLGYALVARKVGGGVRGFVDYVSESSTRLAAFSTMPSLAGRVEAVTTFVASVFTNGWQRTLMFGVQDAAPFDALRLALLVVVPLALLGYAAIRGRSTPLLRIAIALPCSFFAVALLFGSRLGGHHFMSFLPLVYVALAAGFAAAQSGAHAPRPAAAVSTAAFLCALAAVNLMATQREFATLERTGGVGLYSDAVNRLAAEVAGLSPKTLVYFPDWGLALPVTLISGGRIPTSAIVNAAEARRLLCGGRDVAIAIVGDDHAGRFAAWTHEFRWQPPRVETFAQRDGATVAQLGVYTSASRSESACRPG
jgi:hypothetical protein